MFSYSKDKEFEQLVDEYIKLQKNREKGQGYEIGKSWPDFEISDSHKGFDGEEYGFNPYSQGFGEGNIKGKLPEFAVAHMDLSEESYEAQEAVFHESDNMKHLRAHGNDMDLMKNLSGEIHKELMPFVIDVLDEYDYEGSPIYADDLDRSLINGLVEKVIDKSALMVEKSDISIKAVGRRHWDSHKLLRSVVEMSIFNELFGCRRPRYRHICR